MDQEEEIEGLLDGTKSPHKQGGLLEKQGWIWIAFPTIFLLGLVTGWVLNSHLQTIPYAFDTTIPVAKPLSKNSIHQKLTTPAGPGNFSNPFRRPPGKELDKLWDSLYTNSLLLITESEIRNMGKNPADHVRLPADNNSFEYGEKKYLAKFDHIHTIHCLNLIRKWVHSSHYFPHGTPKTIGLIHVDHCIAALLDNLLCHVDYGMFTYQWVDGEPFPQADFTVDRQCRDYGALLEFARERRVDDDVRIRYLPRPGDAVVFEQDRELERVTREWEEAHPGQTTRQEIFAENRKKYEEGVRVWRETGKVPLVGDGEREP